MTGGWNRLDIPREVVAAAIAEDGPLSAVAARLGVATSTLGEYQRKYGLYRRPTAAERADDTAAILWVYRAHGPARAARWRRCCPDHVRNLARKAGLPRGTSRTWEHAPVPTRGCRCPACFAARRTPARPAGPAQLRLDPDGPEWWTHAACKTEDPDLFHPEYKTDAGPALKVCASCPVRDVCAAWSDRLTGHARQGVWGGRYLTRNTPLTVDVDLERRTA